jgi:hypothetical protein
VKLVIDPEDPLDVLRSARRNDCVEARGFVTDYYVRAFPSKRRWELELVRNRYFRHARDAAAAKRRRAQLLRLGWGFEVPDLCPDAVAAHRITSSDPKTVYDFACATLELFGDFVQEVEIEDAQRRRDGWPGVPFAIVRWDSKQNPGFAKLGEAVSRLEGHGRKRPRIYFAEPRSSCLNDIVYLLSPSWFEQDEASDLWRDIVDEYRDYLGEDVVYYGC